MQKKGNTLALLLIGLGAFLLLSKLGLSFGGLFGYLIPVAMIALGYYGVKEGNSFFGWIFIIIGAISLIGKLSWIIGLLVAIGMICFGISMLVGKRKGYPY